MKSQELVDKWSATAKFLCKVYVPAILRKCVIYSVPNDDPKNNIHDILIKFKERGNFPSTWFGKLKKK